MTYGVSRADVPVFPAALRGDLEQICSSTEITHACQMHESSPGARILDAFVEAQLRSHGYACARNVRVVGGSRFDVDLLIEQQDWRAAISIQGGQAARIDLDLLKFIALGRGGVRAERPTYAVLMVSDKSLLRTITGAQGERAFDYARRLRPLFLGSASEIADLFVVEFCAGVPANARAPDTREAHPDQRADGEPERQEARAASSSGAREATSTGPLTSAGVPDIDAALAHFPEAFTAIAPYGQHLGYKSWKIPRQGRPMNWLQWNDGGRSLPIRFANSKGEMRTWKLFARFAPETQRRGPWDRPEAWDRDHKFMPSGPDVWGCSYEDLRIYLAKVRGLEELLREDLELSYRYAIQRYGEGG